MSNQYSGKTWHPEEDKKLADIFPITDSKDVAKVFECSVKVVQNRAHRLGLKKDPVWLKSFKSGLAKAIYAKGGNSGFRKGNDGHGFGFQKGNVPWNARQKDDNQEVPVPIKSGILTGNGYQFVKEVPGGRVVQHVMR